MANAERARPHGLLLANLGTPASARTEDVRAFLDEFLSDPAVVRLPRWLWLPLLRRVILPRRSPRSAAAYRKIWSSAGSPLLVHTRALAQAVERTLGPAWCVAAGMRYGRPSLAEGLAELRTRGATRAWVLPLYPQQSGTTSGTTLERLEALERAGELVLPWRALTIAPDAPGYVAALAARVREQLAEPRGELVVISFHGIPTRYVRAGDRYPEHCARTAQALAQALGLQATDWILAYQSRFGPEPWLGPATRAVVLDAARRGRRAVIVTPGFAADCLETLEELGVALREEVHAAGGPEPLVLPALNDHPLWVDAVAREAAAAEAGGW